MKQSTKLRMLVFAGLVGMMVASAQAKPWVVMEGRNGPGKGKHIVFVVGDEEYRSEDSMPQLAKILAVHHGFKCTVLFAINTETGEIDPKTLDNIPGLEALKTADMMVMFLRFRELPDEQMKYIIDYTNSGHFRNASLRSAAPRAAAARGPAEAECRSVNHSHAPTSPQASPGRHVASEPH